MLGMVMRWSPTPNRNSNHRHLDGSNQIILDKKETNFQWDKMNEMRDTTAITIGTTKCSRIPQTVLSFMRKD